MLIGGTAGFFGGKLDLVVQRLVDAWMAFPGLLLLLTIMSLVGQGLLQLILVLGITGGVVASRLVRGAVIAVKENDYLQAATATGSTRMGALVRHVLPNMAAPIIVVFSINIGAVIISEASLSFLGFGLSPEIPSWGTLLSRDGRKHMEQAPWPGLCLTLTVYSLNMFGDALRDLLDPRLRGGGGRLGAQARPAQSLTDTTLPGVTSSSTSPTAGISGRSAWISFLRARRVMTPISTAPMFC